MHTTPVPIRRASADDVLAIRRLLEELGYPTDVASLRERLDALLDADDCVVFVSDDVTGVVGAQILRTLAEPANAVLIIALVVSGESRGRGVGRALVAAVEEFAVRNGCNRLLVTSGLHRSDAHAFYETIGFERTGVRFVKPISRSTQS